MKSIAFWFIFLASLFALFGMGWGIQMSISGDHLLGPAHAHNNLIGWVTLALYGLYYFAVPAAGQSKLALAHFWVSVLGALIFGVGVALAISEVTELLAVIASLLTILGMALFVINVFQHKSALGG